MTRLYFKCRNALAFDFTLPTRQFFFVALAMYILEPHSVYSSQEVIIKILIHFCVITCSLWIHCELNKP